MSARDIVGGLAGAAVGAVKHPVGTAGGAVSKARTAVGASTAVGTAVAGTVFRRVRGDAGEAKEQAADAAKEVKDTTTEKVGDAAKTTADKLEDAAKTAADKADTAVQSAKKAAKKAPATKSAAKTAPAKKAAPKREPQVVLAEPAPPLEPPIDVVGQALAAEAEDPDNIGFGRTTEPRGASRDEEHGEAALQRAEAAEIIEEIAEASDVGRVDIETPVNTTGADVGFNPDTAEADLQQPGTEPLLDPSLTNEVKSEQDTLSEAAEPKKSRPKKKS